MSTVVNPQPVSVDRIFLDLENPRHKPYSSQGEVIEYLCRAEYVYELARDIAKEGLNPLEIFALIPISGSGKRDISYTVAEGNRRMCAVKLLHDPELAPANRRKDFRRLSEKSVKVEEVLGIVFQSKKQADIWLERIHAGTQGGIGRRTWNAEQKTRHFGDKKNILAQRVLDYAEKKGIITAQQRKGRLTTAQRYLSNPLIREAMGIDSSNSEDIARNRPETDFDAILKRFVHDLVEGTVHSRSKRGDIEGYSRELTSIPGLSGARVPQESLTSTIGTVARRRKKPTKPKRPEHVTFEEEIFRALKNIPSYKLERLYYSICEISLEDHTPLIAIGVWAFFESLTARCGRTAGTAFPDFLSKDKLGRMGFADRESVSSIRQALQRLSGYGNTTKHHDTSATFNGEQLANDVDTLKEVVFKLAQEAAATP